MGRSRSPLFLHELLLHHTYARCRIAKDSLISFLLRWSITCSRPYGRMNSPCVFHRERAFLLILPEVSIPDMALDVCLGEEGIESVAVLSSRWDILVCFGRCSVGWVRRSAAPKSKLLCEPAVSVHEHLAEEERGPLLGSHTPSRASSLSILSKPCISQQAIKSCQGTNRSKPGQTDFSFQVLRASGSDYSIDT